MTLEDQLTTFRENWNGTHVTQYDEHLTYKVVHGFAKSAAYRANQLINSLGLNLIAEMTTDDSFIIKSKKHEKGKDKY